jgi:GcrA cell cycle regulator
MGRDTGDRQALRGAQRLEWTDEHIALLARRRAEGATAEAIARELGSGVSRSAVLGKIHRLGLPQPELKLRREPERRRPCAAGKSRQSPGAGAGGLAAAFAALGLGPFAGSFDESTAHPDAGKAFGTPCMLLALSDTTCRWPIGDPASPGFMFCGAAPFAARPYCLAHCRIAYRPESAERVPRTRRRRPSTIFDRANRAA